MSDYGGKTVLVTGAARGIGKNIATSFARAGASVIILDRDLHRAQETKRLIEQSGGEVAICDFDMRNLDELPELMDDLIHRYGWLDVVVHNARAGTRTGPMEETVDNWDMTMDVILKAPLFASQHLIRRARETGRPICLLMISSILATTVSMESASYHIAKAGLESMTRYLAVNGGEYGVRANAIRPGLIIQDEHQERYWSDDNESYRQSAGHCHPLGDAGSSNDIANTALFLCSESAKFITGQVIPVDGGVMNHEPFTLTRTAR